jgi:cyclophilin family peptidyl-prolyl cis-trans isomerase
MRHISVIWTVLLLLLVLSSGPLPAAESGTSKLTAEPQREAPYLVIQVKDFGPIAVELFPAAAPRNVANIESLARKGFYDGLTIHRVAPGFVIQGGDPKGDGTGGPDYTVPAEIGLKHVRGALAMARTGDDVNPDKASSSCQFYICLQDLPTLDNNYTVIGQTREGMAVVDSIAKVARDPGDKPLKPVVMQKVTVEMRPSARPEPEERDFMTIAFRGFGKVKVELFPEDAPRSVISVESLAAEGFYDGAKVDKVIPGFVIQGSDPNTGRGCCGRCPNVPSEFKRKNVRGAVGIGYAPRLTKASATCEFYICLADLPRLDSAGFAVIGQVVEGMPVVEKIAGVKCGTENRPSSPVVIANVRIETGKREE